VQSASTSVPGDISATIVRILAYICALAILAIAAASFFRPPAGAGAIQFAPPPPPEWVNVDRPHPAFELQMPDLTAVGSNYAILRRTADGARKDELSFGDVAAAGPYVMIEVYRPGPAGERFIDAPSEIAVRILPFAVIDDVKPAGQIDSKFGAVPLVDFAITAQNTPHAAGRRCLGFAKPFDAPAIQIAGWYCSAGQEAVDRAVLTCALDRLTILSAGGDDQLAGLFARAELKRTFCGQRNPILAATPERDVAVTIPRSVKRGTPPQH
jgi:hypothetical protein